MTTTTVVAESRVLRALDSVRDPELDEPVTTLGFVASVDTAPDGSVAVHLRLPTYFCAPNFAFLMVADAYDAVSAIEGIGRVEVTLDDHFASDAINSGVAAHAGFVQSFDGEAVSELDSLRANFLRKAVLAGTDLVCRPLVAAGTAPEQLAELTLGQVPASPALDRLRARRSQLGLPAGDDAALMIDPATGASVGAGGVPLHLRKARLTRVSLEANGSICRGMLRVRYDSDGLGEESQDD